MSRAFPEIGEVVAKAQSGKALATGGKPGSLGSGGRGGANRPPISKGRQITPQGRGPGLWIGIGSVVMVIAVVLVIVLVGSSSKTPPATTSSLTPTAPDPTVLQELASVPTSVIDSVGTGGSQIGYKPTVSTSNPKLEIDGKSGAVFVGAEFCPYCGAERWSLYQAFSRFGTWSNVLFTQSSAFDAYPQTNTFSFRSADYTSPDVTFDFAEIVGNATGPGDYLPPPDQMNSTVASIYAKYGIKNNFPFVDIGNKFIFTSPEFSPQVLQGLSWQEIGNKLSNASDPVTQSIVGAANALTAAICNVDGQKPSSVCNDAGVKKAAADIGAG